MIRSALASQAPRFKNMGLGVSDPAFLMPDSVPAPVGGWDTLSPLAQMDPTHAIQLNNWIPRPGYIEVRKGSQPVSGVLTSSGDFSPTDFSVKDFYEAQVGLGDFNPNDFSSADWYVGAFSIDTLMAYNAPNPVNSKLFSVAGSTIYDATSAALLPVGGITLTNSQCQYTNIYNTFGSAFLIVCNGVDTERIYNGTTWGALAVTGPTPGTIANVAVHKGRLWMAITNSSVVWYLPVGAISGPATQFDLSPFFSLGGYVQAMGVWSVDTRQFVDDYIAFISSRGEVAVYQGTDPTSTATWALIGIYRIGAPINRKCTLKINGDLFIICVDGLVPMTEMLSTDRGAANRVSPFMQIMDTVRQAIKLYQSNYGWQFIEYFRGQIALLNVPVVTNQSAVQYGINVLTGAPFSFSGMNANCWEIFNDNLYYGANDGNVYQFDVDAADNELSIVATMQTAWNYFGKRGMRKKFNSVRPLITTDFAVTPALGLNVDFGTGGNVAIPSFDTSGGGTGSLWDSAVWDSAIWPEEAVNSIQWQSVAGEGFAASLIMQVTTTKQGTSQGVTLQLNAFDINMEPGGML